ncbi:RNA polymerase, sigma 28 subunit, FliA/WhiG family (plasmid) [Deferribacter desulfuricans SSM1]|uniref:RNA polymerase, sigma 28 subunit, FliA/WhiG family n=1 Tax=Deferribacter desulfuricans (strain DSM 14783 / JCM 11476 / NBRC 101012 / SSM1) TaxID=639282 RepID=D3PET1_DEFDS|nr:FliA/WhiG family RNA polymerase sigma factor [Deferribacter desulfuricans]BAI81723.1 RNA polymerase, sigma 28 subunit, FliA/WhiG family [Deferribacter desulfuricans SSM1]
MHQQYNFINFSKKNKYLYNNKFYNKEDLTKEFLPKIDIWVKKAYSKLPDHIDIDEVYSAACYGFVEALNRYDPSQNIDFKYFVEKRVKGAILDVLRRLDLLSRTKRTKLKDLENKIQTLSKELGRQPTPEEIAEKYGIDTEEIYNLLELSDKTHIISLNTLLDKDDNEGHSLIDFIKSDLLTPEEQVSKQELIDILQKEIENLKEKERLVITLYYYEELTMKEIGEILGVTEARVCQIHNKVVEQLKEKILKMIK